MTTDDLGLCDPDVYERGGVPHGVFTRLRAEAPVFWHSRPEGGGFWAITRYRDVERISLDPKSFSSSDGVMLRDWSRDELEMMYAQLINMDPPRHSKYRRIVNHGFTPKMLRNLEQHIRDIARTIVDAVAPKGEVDFVTEVAAELPLQVILEMMGVPLEDRHKVFDWSNTMIGFDDPEYGGGVETGKIAAMELYSYANQLAAERKAKPQEDLVSVLMHANVDGEALNETEFDQFFLLLAVAGNETTRNLISGGMLALMEHPAELARLQTDPALLTTAIDEMLRWVTPVNYFRRTAMHDTEVRGQKVRAGEKVVMYYASANRDEEIFPDAQRFDVGRTPNEHLAFGFGPHFCLGSHLARLEIRVMFEEILRRLPDIQLAGPVQRLRSNFINGIKHMPVRFTPERQRLRA
jgi:cholest-4-en-3-one 26-monooxygenase